MHTAPPRLLATTPMVLSKQMETGSISGALISPRTLTLAVGGGLMLGFPSFPSAVSNRSEALGPHEPQRLCNVDPVNDP